MRVFCFLIPDTGKARDDECDREMKENVFDPTYEIVVDNKIVKATLTIDGVEKRLFAEDIFPKPPRRMGETIKKYFPKLDGPPYPISTTKIRWRYI